MATTDRFCIVSIAVVCLFKNVIHTELCNMQHFVTDLIHHRAFEIHPRLSIVLFIIGYCCCSVAKLCLTLCDTMDCSTPDSDVLHYLPEIAQIHSIESVMLSNHLILCCLLFLSTFLSIRVFSNETTLHITWPKYWSFSFSISPSKEYSVDFL